MWPLFTSNVANSYTIMQIYKVQNALKNWWQQTTNSIFTDIKKVDSTIPFIKKNLFLPGYYTPKPLKLVTFTLKQKILGSTIVVIPAKPSHIAVMSPLSLVWQLQYNIIRCTCSAEHLVFSRLVRQPKSPIFWP